MNTEHPDLQAVLAAFGWTLAEYQAEVDATTQAAVTPADQAAWEEWSHHADRMKGAL